MQVQETIQQVITYLRGIWRFRWYAMGIAWFTAIIGWVYVSAMPDQYEASAQVLVDTDSMLRPLLRGLAVQSNIDQRVQLMTKTLMSRPNLEKLARMTDLDINAKTPAEMDALLTKLKNSIRLTSARRQDFYTISAVYGNAAMAKKIVESLLTIFIEDSLGNTRQDSNVAQKFLMQQIKEYETRLVDAENRIKEFKQQNIGKMPDAGRGYFEQLQAEQTTLEQAKLQLREAENRRDELKRQLVGEEPVFGFGTTSIEQPQATGTHPLDERIKHLRDQIDELLLSYTDKHPEVIARREQLEALEKQREKEMESKPKEALKPAQRLETNPIYQQLKISLGQTEAEVSSLKVRVEEYTKRIAKLKELVNTGPEIEAKLQSLNRDYALNKQNYDALIARLESAKMAEQAEQTGDDIKFQIINPPRVPLKPSGPNRFLLSSATIIAAFGAGIGLAFLFSQLRPVVYDRRTLGAVSGCAVFGVVSRYWTPELLVKKRIEFGGFIAVGLMLGLVYIGVLYLQLSNAGLLHQLRDFVGSRL